MAAEKRDWTVPTPLRALLWWPAAAFVLVMIAPDAAAASIAGSGALLVTLGAVVPLLTRRLRGRVVAAAAGAPLPIDADPPTIEMPELPTIEIPPVNRAA